MKVIGLVFAFIALVTGLIAAYFWSRASMVPIVPTWKIEPGESDASQQGWQVRRIEQIGCALDSGFRCSRSNWHFHFGFCVSVSAMTQRNFDKENLNLFQDWHGNSASIQCPVCGKVYIASMSIGKGFRKCPKCGKSSIQVTQEKVIVTSSE
jgi:predicted RNA-binding Zn-ribbon protein involved in translation (DUF1610 family)